MRLPLGKNRHDRVEDEAVTERAEPAPRVDDDVLQAVLQRDRRKAQLPFEGPDRRKAR